MYFIWRIGILIFPFFIFSSTLKLLPYNFPFRTISGLLIPKLYPHQQISSKYLRFHKFYWLPTICKRRCSLYYTRSQQHDFPLTFPLLQHYAKNDQAKADTTVWIKFGIPSYTVAFQCFIMYCRHYILSILCSLIFSMPYNRWMNIYMNMNINTYS